MACGARCGKKDIINKKFQDLSGWKPNTLNDLKKIIGGQIDDTEVRVYTVASTYFDKNDNLIRHEGCGPNLEGGLATLYTCKRSMRQGQSSDYWKGKWILGVTSRAENKNINRKHYLLYLMKVEKAFDSYKDLHQHLKQNNPSALQAKNANKNLFGDIYQPKADCTDPLDPKQYISPPDNHSHGGDEWKLDISYELPSTKRLPTPLLLGDVNNTFVWQKPMIIFKEDRGTNNKKMTST